MPRKKPKRNKNAPVKLGRRTARSELSGLGHGAKPFCCVLYAFMLYARMCCREEEDGQDESDDTEQSSSEDDEENAGEDVNPANKKKQEKVTVVSHRIDPHDSCVA